jgi:hypothetical protein
MSIYLWSSEPSKIYVWSNEVKEVYVGTEKVRPTFPIPTSWLLWYRPLQSDLKDASWNWKDWSWYSWTGGFSAIWGKTGARVTTKTVSWRTVTAQHIVTSLQYDGSNISMCWWIYYATQVSDWLRPWIINNSHSASSDFYGIWQRVFDSFRTYLLKNGTTYLLWNRINTWWWNFVCVIISWTTLKYYLNWTLTTTSTVSSWTTNSNNWRLWCWHYDSSAWFWWTDWYVRHCAVYNRALTDAEVLQIYNNTK